MANSVHFPRNELERNVMRPLAVFVLLFLAFTGMPSQTHAQEVTFYPSRPTVVDDIIVLACYPFGPFVETTSVSIAGQVVTVRLVQDGFDFSPNPPHCAEVQVGRLPAGSYTFVVTSELFAFPTNTQTFALDVSALPIPMGHPSLAALGLLLGLFAVRACLKQGWRRGSRS
jgi:hypothetical protein